MSIGPGFDLFSPEVRLNEIDLSVTPTQPPGEDGLLVVGRALQGPAMEPIVIKSVDALYKTFGPPCSMVQADDVFRDGNHYGPTYAHYAAEAWLSQGNSGVTFIRLAGEDFTGTQAAGYVKAGWKLGTHLVDADPDSSVSAFGIFVAPSSSGGSSGKMITSGTLGAIIYTKGAAVTLAGTHPIDGASTASLGAAITSNSNTSVAEFTARIFTGTNNHATYEDITFSFDPDANNFIRNALNTNPQKLHGVHFGSGAQEKYFLGESFETAVHRKLTAVGSGSAAGQQIAICLPLYSGSNKGYSEREAEAKNSSTGWFINRETNPQATSAGHMYSAEKHKLFKIHSLHQGEFFQNNYAIVIENLRLGNAGNNESTFTLKVVDSQGNTVEKFSNLTVNKNSGNYIAQRIGTQKRIWDTSNNVFQFEGEYINKSSYIRIEEHANLNSLSDKYALPFGFYGPVKPVGFSVFSQAANPSQQGAAGHIPHTTGDKHGVGDNDLSASYVSGSSLSGALGYRPEVFSDGGANTQRGMRMFVALGIDHSASFDWPSFQLTEQNTNNGSNYPKNTLFGVRQALANSDVHQNKTDYFKRADYKDIAKMLPNTLDTQTDDSDSALESAGAKRSFIFSLDDIINDSVNPNNWYYESGSLVGGSSYTQANGTKALLDQGIKQFVAPFFGGFDGLDITQADPFSNANVLKTETEATHHAVYSIQKAIDIATVEDVADAGLIGPKYDVISIPNVTHVGLTDSLMTKVRDRQDALAIVDLDDNFLQKFENSGSADTTNGKASDIIATAQTRLIDNNYAATYHPRLQFAAPTGFGVGSGTFMNVTVPPSVAAIAVLAQSDAISGNSPWFAPAGFNRGGLESLGFINTLHTLTKGQRDDLYQENINPIARFGAVGRTVVFGQKTLQQSATSLDRINVRRLMIYIKKRVGRVATATLFEQNVRGTWNNFKAQVAPILNDVKARGGISEYKLVLDETTTTDSIQDNNQVYAQVFLKPVRSIEFIQVDFIITNQGVEF